MLLSTQRVPASTSAPATHSATTACLWRFPTSAPSFGSAALGDVDGDGRDEIVFGTYFNDEHLYAVRARDGSRLWSFKSERGPIDTSVLLADVDRDGLAEAIFGDSATGTLFCLDGNGAVVWTFKGQSGTDSPPAAADLNGDGTVEIVYGTMFDGRTRRTGHVNVLDGTTGKLVWTAEVPGCVQSEPALAHLNGDATLDVLVNNWMGDNRLRALDGRDGRELWHFDTGDWVYHGVSVFDADAAPHSSVAGGAARPAASLPADGAPHAAPEVVLADRKGHVWMLEGDTGAVRWMAELKHEMEGMVFAPTTLVDAHGDGVPEIAVFGMHAHLLDASGRVRWERKFASPFSIARGAAAYDVDGDGREELIFAKDLTLHVVRAADGVDAATYDLRGGDSPEEQADHAPLVFQLPDVGCVAFIVTGRGRSGPTQPENYGHATAVRLGPGAARSARQTPLPWGTFRGGPRRTGWRDPPKQGEPRR